MRINSFAQQEIFLFATTREGGIDFPRWTIYIDGGPRSADGETLALGRPQCCCAIFQRTGVWTLLTSSPSPQVMSQTPTTSTRPQSSPTCSSWTRRRSSPTKSLLRTPTTMTLYSRICSTKHIERKPITLNEKTCLSVCRRRQCPTERGDLLGTERGDLLSKEAQIRTLLDKQKKQILAE